MTIAEALTITKGSYATHPHADRGQKKLRVTHVWANEARTIVMFRVHSLTGSDWIHAEAFGKWVPPKDGAK